MNTIHSTGFLIFRQQRSLEFLLINDTFSNKRHWTPPKGKVIGDEDELKCAIRETINITGVNIKELTIDKNFRAELRYLSGSQPKRVVYYLARLADNARVLPTGEGLNLSWLTLAQAIEKSVFRTMGDVLRQASVYIETNKLNIIQPRQRSNVDSMEHKLKNLNIALPLDSQRHIITRQRQEQRPEQRYEPRDRSRIEKTLSTSPAPGNNDNPLYKTRLCERFETEGFCPYGPKCTFAHGVVELKEKKPQTNEKPSTVENKIRESNDNPLYKTKLCERFMKENFCQYGPKCNFAHGRAELKERTSTGPPPAQDMQKLRGWRGNPSGEHHSPEAFFARRLETGSLSPPSRTLQSDVGLEQQDCARDTPILMPTSNELSSRSISPAEPLTTPEKETHEDTKALQPLRRREKNEKVSLNHLLSGKADKDKSWLRVLEPSDDEQGRINSLKQQMNGPEGGNGNRSTNGAGKRHEYKGLIDDLKRFIDARKDEEPGKRLNDEFKEITRIEFRNNLSKKELFNVLIPSLFSDLNNLFKEVNGRNALCKKFVRTEQDQIAFLRAWEEFLLLNDHAVPKTPALFKLFYDIDLVDEESFIKWNSLSRTTTKVQESARPFIDWLSTAEEDDE
ncbi:hypothetical protein K493DRAFT_407074 [Basidiobolus meristosporus CBS 931.73]|uniref:Nudix hydrolase domain-containing protein n=1 Tax=Basidiobolus meristosporus CBS 931.73 TaxID=1314790 RepID=A0A1Y1YG41_9FUNG|nr:hypothetical protein K493DRAFT_407074 [Basidiobolus meristosporus CBS 931.73]|eukprot:ORX96918.1 hypothetical protein K493DRAFT_407074 [Basidiobolus meristosporus CBS 931.73]